MRFTLRQLQVFATIGRLENVTLAAETLAMSQSAASTALAELEIQFQKKLFDRMGKRLKLNERGRILLPRALEILDRASEFEAFLIKDNLPASLRLGASVTIANYLAPRLIDQYMRRYPDADVKLEVGNTRKIASLVADFDIDLGLIEGQIAGPSLSIIDWLGDDLAVFCGASHPLAANSHVTFDQLLSESWVVRELGSGTRQTLEHALGDRLHDWKIAFELGHTEAIKGLVGEGRLVGCLSRLALTSSFKSGSLVELTVPELKLRRRFSIVTNRQKYRTFATDSFLSICQEFEF